VKTKLPEVLRVKGVLYSYTDYPQGSIERAKALFADMWDKSQLTETVISGWDDAKARILKEKAWEKLGYPDPETVLREIFGERYDLVELGKVHLRPDSLLTEAEKKGRKAAKVVLKFKGSPGITMAQLAKEVGCSVSYAADVIRKAGLKTPSHKEVIQRDHIKPDGTLHIGGEPASQREVAKVVGCDQTVVRDALRGNSGTGKTPHPTPSPALRKAQGAFLKLSREERVAFDAWRALT